MTDGLTWHQLTTRAETRVLQSFVCTADFPRTPGGRRMPHDRPWEWEAQRHLRQLSQLLKSGDLVLIARSGADVVGCVHLQFSTEGTLLEAFHAAAGVALDVRRQGGRVPDQLLAEARKIAFTKAIQSGSSHLVLAGKVHVRNAASQHMLTRAGWEPRDAPSNDYQLWAAIIPVE